MSVGVARGVACRDWPWPHAHGIDGGRRHAGLLVDGLLVCEGRHGIGEAEAVTC